MTRKTKHKTTARWIDFDGFAFMMNTASVYKACLTLTIEDKITAKIENPNIKTIKPERFVSKERLEVDWPVILRKMFEKKENNSDFAEGFIKNAAEKEETEKENRQRERIIL